MICPICSGNGVNCCATARSKAADNELHAFYVDVASGVGNHGDFLKNFAEAFVRADPINREILRYPAKEFAKKYKPEHDRGVVARAKKENKNVEN